MAPGLPLPQFSAMPSEVISTQVGSSPEFVLLSSRYANSVVMLNRLGGSQIIGITQISPPNQLGYQAFRGPDVIGAWPCGMGESPTGRYIYVLNHFSREVRIVDLDLFLDPNQQEYDIVKGSHYLGICEGIDAEEQFTGVENPASLELELEKRKKQDDGEEHPC